MRLWAGTRMALLALAMGLLAASSAEAWVTAYTIPTGTKDAAGNDLAATVTFSSTTSNLLDVRIENLQGNLAQSSGKQIIESGQFITDLEFTTGKNRTTTGFTGINQAFERTINSDGTFSTTPPVAPGWSVTNNGTVIRLFDPGLTHSIIGPPDATNHYSGLLAAFKDPTAFNPYLAGVVTFELTVPGLTSDPSEAVSFASFSFGTGSIGPTQCTLSCVPGTRVPEPASLLLLGVGLLGLAGYGLRKRLNTK